MNRRSFLRGTILSLAGTEALVKLATPAEASTIILGRELVLGQPEDEQYFAGHSPEIYMRRNDGGFVCVGLWTRLEISQRVESYETWTGEAVLIPGLKRGQLFFEGQRR